MNKQTVRRIRKSIGGFTLIELLVVVLIIGILAAIAVPQYFKVVEKSKAAEANAWIAAVTGAEESYLNKNGFYCTTTACLSAFDVAIPDPTTLKYFDVVMDAGSAAAVDWQAVMTRGKGTAGAGSTYYGAYTMNYKHSGSPPLTCGAGGGSGACTDMLP
jgi:prepilin-type N-terminal cleavage/methylation domain-containing protein